MIITTSSDEEALFAYLNNLNESLKDKLTICVGHSSKLECNDEEFWDSLTEKEQQEILLTSDGFAAGWLARGNQK